MNIWKSKWLFALCMLGLSTSAFASGDYEDMQVMITGACGKAQAVATPVTKGTRCVAYGLFNRSWQENGVRLTGKTFYQGSGHKVMYWVELYNPDTGKTTRITSPREMKLNDVGEKIEFTASQSGVYSVAFDYTGIEGFADYTIGYFDLHVK